MSKQLVADAARIVRQDLCESARRAQTAQLNGRLTDRHVRIYMSHLKTWHEFEMRADFEGWDDPLFQPMPPIDNRVGVR